MIQGDTDFWLAVAVLAVITYLIRSLPFLLSARSPRLERLARQGSRWSALGPALLAAIAAAVIAPDLAALADQPASAGAYVAGLLATALAVRLTRNTGLAVLLGTCAYGLLLALGGSG